MCRSNYLGNDIFRTVPTLIMLFKIEFNCVIKEWKNFYSMQLQFRTKDTNFRVSLEQKDLIYERTNNNRNAETSVNIV